MYRRFVKRGAAVAAVCLSLALLISACSSTPQTEDFVETKAERTQRLKEADARREAEQDALKAAEKQAQKAAKDAAEAEEAKEAAEKAAAKEAKVAAKANENAAKNASVVEPKAESSKPLKTNDEPKEKSKENKKSAKQEVDAVAAVPAGPPPPPPIPPEATQRFERALTLLGANDFAQAAKELQALSIAYPDYSGPMTNLGIVYLKTDKLDDAEKTLKAATQRGEPSAVAFNQLGIVYRKLGRFADADKAYSEALRIDPSYALAHLNRGVLCDLYLQQPQRALEDFERYLQLTKSPDTRVTSWVKELQSRLGVKTAPPAAPATPPPTEPTTTPPTAQLMLPDTGMQVNV